MAQPDRGIREGDGGGLEQNAVTVLHQSPGHHDVLADRVRPPADPPDLSGQIERESALGHQRRLVQTLHPPHRSYAEVVVPLLHPRQ